MNQASDLFKSSGSRDSAVLRTEVLGTGSLIAPAIDATAKASMVNRTRRVVCERARTLKARRSRVRSLWIPMLVCSAMMLILCSAVWSVLDQYELTPTGIPDASNQLFVLLLWFLPVSAALLAMVWLRHFRSRSENEAAQ